MKIDVSTFGQHYQLSAAILLYERKQENQLSFSNGSDLGPEGIATVHKLALRDGRPTIEAGRPMNEADYQNMIKVLAPSERPQMVWQDHSVLARGMGRMVWWTPPMNRAMFFKKSGHFSGKSFENQAICPLPGMVWQSTGTSLYVYAFRGSAMPEKETRLCQAPLFNVWAKGEVCHGSAVAPMDEQKDDPKAWEKFLFGSHFTHPNFVQKDRLVKGQDPHTFWKQMLEAPPPSFPEQRLVDLELTVADLLEPDFKTRISSMRAQGEF